MLPSNGHLRARVGKPGWLAQLAISSLCLVLCGCGAAAFKAGSSAVSSALTASSSAVAFGSVMVGQSASGYVKLVNPGSASVTISKLNITGQSFSSSAQDGLPITVAAGSTVNLGVQFKPLSAGTLSGQLTITNSSSPTPLSVTLNGTGTLALVPALTGLSCASTSLTAAGNDICTVTLSAAPVSDVTISLTSDNAAVTVPGNVVVAAGSSSTDFNAAYTAVSSLQTATLTASSSGATRTLALQLNPIVANLEVSTLDLNFGTVNVDGTYSQPLIMTSTGNAPVSIDSITITGPGFSVPTTTLPMILNPGQSASLMVQFNPNGSGNVVGQLTINDSSPLLATMLNLNASSSSNSKKIRLSGTAIPAVKQLSCATNTMTGGGTNACSVLLNSAAGTNGLAVALASSSNAVSLPTSIMVPAGATSSSFDASASTVTTTQTATLTASTTSSSKSLNLQLTATVPTLAVSSQALAFGNVSVNSPAAQSLTLSSTGTSAVTVSAAAVTGAAFTVSGATFPMTLNPGQTAVLTAQFSPTAAGSASGQLTLSSDSSTGSSTVVSLSGTGVPVLSALSCTTASITGSGTDSCLVTLNVAAATGGFAVSLLSDNSAVTVPATVTVPAGAASVGFSATVSSVTTAQTATLTASASGALRTFAIQLGSAVPTLAINTASLAFGTVPVNSPATQSVTLSSTGNSAVTVSAAAATGSGFAVSGASFPLTLNPGQTASLTVQFNPTSAGAAAGQLTLTSNSSSGASSVVSLSGTGVPVLSALNCSTGSFSAAGSDACTVTLNAAAAIGGFVVNLASNNSAVTVPASVTVPAGASSAGFTASVSTVSTSQAAVLTASAGTASQSFTIQLGVSVPTLTLSAANVAFGNVSVNSSASQSLTLSSTGTSSVTVNAATIAGSGFTVFGATFPLSLNPGQTATLTIQFKPTSSGSSSGQLTLTSNSSTGTSSVISLSGTGIPVLSSLNCTTASITGSGTDSCTATLNAAAATGGFVVALSSSNSAVTLPASMTIPAGAASAGFTATISSVATTQTALLTANANGVSKSFSLQLNPGVPTLSANATSIAFGSVNLNSPTTQSVSLTSTGTSAATISAISITGTGFAVTGATLPLTLNPNQTVILNITFNPTVTGSQTGQLTISSNSSSGTIGIGLSGTGQSVSHEVDLTWSAPTSSPDPVVGYIVLRASSGSSSYQQLNSSVVTLTSYVDTAVQSGQTYNYMVESVGSSGNISSPSNVATAVIP